MSTCTKLAQIASALTIIHKRACVRSPPLHPPGFGCVSARQSRRKPYVGASGRKDDVLHAKPYSAYLREKHRRTAFGQRCEPKLSRRAPCNASSGTKSTITASNR